MSDIPYHDLGNVGVGGDAGANREMAGSVKSSDSKPDPKPDETLHRLAVLFVMLEWLQQIQLSVGGFSWGGDVWIDRSQALQAVVQCATEGASDGGSAFYQQVKVVRLTRRLMVQPTERTEKLHASSLPSGTFQVKAK